MIPELYHKMSTRLNIISVPKHANNTIVNFDKL